MKQPVIYKIRNVVNQKFYVGSTTDTRERFRTHRSRLRKGNHHAKHLQAAWNKYGEDCFKFEVVEVVESVEQLFAAEDRWLREHFGKPYCYNAGHSAEAPMRGRFGLLHPRYNVPISDKQKGEISESLKAFYEANPEQHPRRGKTHSDETKAKISATKLANPVKPWLGKERSDETKAKIGAAQRGKPKATGRTVSEEGRAKIRANIEAGRSHMHWLGRNHSEESRLKMSKRVLAVHADGRSMEFNSLTETLQFFGMKMPTLNRALKSGNPITKGEHKGWQFRYAMT